MVPNVSYIGPTGGLLTAGEQCAFAVASCVPKQPMTGYEQSPDYGGPDPAWMTVLVKPLLILVIIAALFLADRSSAKADYLTPDQYHAQFGPCACPGDKSKIGLCGHLSAYCRCGGHEPLCFAGDDDKVQREKNRRSHCHGCVPYGQ